MERFVRNKKYSSILKKKNYLQISTKWSRRCSR